LKQVLKNWINESMTKGLKNWINEEVIKSKESTEQ